MLLIIPFLFSCTDDEGGRGGNVTLSSETIVIDADAGLGILNVDADSDWYIDDIPDWCGTVRPSMGSKGMTEVRIRGRFYYGTEDRQASLKVVCGNVTRTLTLVQTGKRSIDIVPGIQRVTSAGGEISIAVKSSFNYELLVSENSSFVSVVGNERPLSGNVRLVFQANDGADRDAEIIFSDPSSSFEKTLVIPQDGDPYFQDRASLMALYENTAGDSWISRTGWGCSIVH